MTNKRIGPDCEVCGRRMLPVKRGDEIVLICGHHPPERGLTDPERERFEAILTAGNIALLRGEYDGRDAAFIVALNADSDGSVVLVSPLAVLVDDEMLARCTVDGEMPSPV
jgi:hypothetical protein